MFLHVWTCSDMYVRVSYWSENKKIFNIHVYERLFRDVINEHILNSQKSGMQFLAGLIVAMPYFPDIGRTRLFSFFSHYYSENITAIENLLDNLTLVYFCTNRFNLFFCTSFCQLHSINSFKI